jgi:glycosyltransferase involved in cell wall biosynthesis
MAHNFTEDSFAAMSYNLAHHIAGNGYRVLFISYSPNFTVPFSKKVGSGQIDVYSWPGNKRPTDLRAILWYSKLYFRYRPKITIGHFVGSNITTSVSKFLSVFRAKTFVYYHTLSSAIDLDRNGVSLKNKLLRFRKKVFYLMFCDYIICPSLMAKEDFDSVFSKRKKSIVVVNPIKDRFAGTNSERKSAKNIIVSYLGRLDNTKGVLEFVNAFGKYASLNPGTLIKIRIAGSGANNEKIGDLVKNQPQISMYGQIPYNEIDTYIRDSDFIIIPSLSDSFPTVGLESLMNGVPLLLSTETGLADYITDKKEGFLFDPTEEGINEVLGRVEKSYPVFNGFSENARKTYLEKFTIENYCKSMSEILFQ